jgi:hypothetical protein
MCIAMMTRQFDTIQDALEAAIPFLSVPNPGVEYLK